MVLPQQQFNFIGPWAARLQLQPGQIAQKSRLNVGALTQGQIKSVYLKRGPRIQDTSADVPQQKGLPHGEHPTEQVRSAQQ
jgi:hypothetical protein